MVLFLIKSGVCIMVLQIKLSASRENIAPKHLHQQKGFLPAVMLDIVGTAMIVVGILEVGHPTGYVLPTWPGVLN